MTKSSRLRASLRLAAALLLTGQLSYVGVTLLHAGGEANNHHAIFEIYARNQIWTAVHLGQFACMAMLVFGLLALFVALDLREAGPTTLGKAGSAASIAALALFGALQAVDGVALKQAVDAWAAAPEAAQAARFAGAETMRWLEWGMRSYHDFALGLALGAAAIALSRMVAWPLGILAALASGAYAAQGWIAGVDGFSAAHSVAIVAGWVLNAAWMAWLCAASFSMREPGT